MNNSRTPQNERVIVLCFLNNRIGKRAKVVRLNKICAILAECNYIDVMFYIGMLNTLDIWISSLKTNAK